jgi:multicomponent Na+:H+ antiporter subunit D
VASPLAEQNSRRMLVPIAALAIVTVVIGLGAGWLFDLSMTAAAQLLDTAGYIKAVLG